MSQTSLNRILPGFWRTIAWALLGCSLLALVIFVCFQLHTRLGIVALLCLLTVVILSLQGRFFVALFCSVLATFGLDYFFTQPVFSLAVTRPEDIAALLTFLAIGSVVRALGSKLRKSCWALARENTERKRAEEAWSEAQAELAHVTRVATLGELAGSIAHEVNQPVTAIINNANTCLALLPGETSQLEDVRQGLSDIISEADRASAVIERIRGLIKKSPPQKNRLDLNETIGVVIALARGELQRNEVLLRTKLADDLPLVVGDRIQLQQVILNLIINAIEAMSGVSDGQRELSISSEEVIGMPGEPEEGRLADAAGLAAERRPVRHSLGDPATVGPNAGLSNVILRTHGEAGTPNGPASWFQWRIQVQGWIQRIWVVSLTRSTLQSLKAWGWACRSAVLLLKLIKGGYGRRQMCQKALCFNSPCRLLMTTRLRFVW